MTDSDSKEDHTESVRELKQWVDNQPELPGDLGDKLLLRFLHSCYYDAEKAKKTIQVFCNIRATSPELFDDRDPLSEAIQNTLSFVNLARLPISGNRHLWIWQLNDPGLQKFNVLDDARLFFVNHDTHLLLDEELVEGDVVILDLKDITFRIFTKINFSIAKKMSKYQQEATPLRLQQIHMVNVPSFMDKIFSLVRPLISQEHLSLVHFHARNSNTLLDYISKEDLPEDFGGTLGRMEDHAEEAKERIKMKREILKNNNLWKAVDPATKQQAKQSSTLEFD